MYQAYPGGAQIPEQQRAPVPKSVLTAVKLMYAGAALEVISLVLYLLSIGSIRTAIHKKEPAWDTSKVHAYLTAVVSADLIVAVISIALWLWMAWANKRGSNWARGVASVLFGLNTLFLVLGLAQTHTALTLLLPALVWLAGLGAIVFLWQKDSSAYFAAPRV
jgi:hypothetical protein